MTNSTFVSTVLEPTLERCRKVLMAKNIDYSRGSDDILHSFKEVARRKGIHPLTVWSILFDKHIFAIDTYTRQQGEMAEPINGRFEDAINYLILGLALIEEAKAFNIIEAEAIKIVESVYAKAETLCDNG